MRAKLAMIAALALAGCTKTVEVKVPVPVPTAVYTPCPKPQLQSAGDPPALPIDGVAADTPVDVAANTWKATVLVLQAYVGKLRTEVADVRSALGECTKER